MEDIFVPYKISIKLKEIGFDEKCLGFYYCEDGLILEKEMTVIKSLSNIFPAPTFEQVYKWFRDKGIICSINPRYFGELYFYEIFTKEGEERKRSCISNENLTYEECREKVILKMIELYERN